MWEHLLDIIVILLLLLFSILFTLIHCQPVNVIVNVDMIINALKARLQFMYMYILPDTSQ